MSIASEAARRAWSRMTPEQRAARVAGIQTNRGGRKGSKDRHVATIERLTESANQAIHVLQSTDDPRMRCALAVELLLAGIGKPRKPRNLERQGELVRAELRSGPRVYIDVRELWTAALTGAIIPTRHESGEPVSEKPIPGIPAWAVSGDVERIENLI